MGRLPMAACDDTTAYLRRVSAAARRLLAADDPYEVAVEIDQESAHAMTTADPAADVCLIRAALTDRMECRPGERREAAAQMTRAAREWLALDLADRAAVDRHLDHGVRPVGGRGRT